MEKLGTIIFENEKEKHIRKNDGAILIVEKRQEGLVKTGSGYFKIFKKRWFDDWKTLNAGQRSIMVSMWLYGAGTGQCWVSMRELAVHLGMDKETIFRNVRKLEKMKFLMTKKCKGRGRHYNHYYLLK